jgi:hypothetical protein
MGARRLPQPDDWSALKELIGGRPVDRRTLQSLITCNLVEKFNGTALLTVSGIEAAARLTTTER